MTQRERFLKEIWTPYPPAPGADWRGGEVVEMSESHLILGAQGEKRSFSYSSVALKGSDVSPLEILKSGDKVAVQLNGQTLNVQLLAPQLRPMRSISLSPEIARRWNQFLKVIRQHWTDQGFLEIATPSLVTCPGFEPTLDPVAVGKKFLPTSPEIHLKKALAAGFSEIFEIRSCFRAGEFSQHHQPEFTMLEWYRSYARFEVLAQDLKEILKKLEQAQLTKMLVENFSQVTVRELFQEIFKFSLRNETTEGELQELCRSHNVEWSATDTWNDLFHRLWIQFIDPWLANRTEPVLVTAFPARQAALARIGADGWAERMELYWRGLEIANGFHELNDPVEQAARAKEDLGGRKANGRSEVPMDEEFIAALQSGMAPGVGMALGLERLFMAAQGIMDIRALKAFPYER